MILLSYLFHALYVSLLALLVWAWRSAKQSATITAKKPAFSVIIAARNEEANLRRYLSGWLNQQYPQFELIIVLDRCQDESAAFLGSVDDPRLNLIHIETVPAGWAPKKWALQKGIETATYDWLAFTDADCEVSPHWLSQLAAKTINPNELVLGLGPYRPYPGWLSLMQRFETQYAALQYIGFAQLGLPYMGVGRNLAYHRDFFMRHAGFSRFAERLSGDDDLLVNAFADPKKTAVMIEPASWTWSEPERSWKDWFLQKKRHLSASPAYSKRSQFLLGLFHLSHMGSWIFTLIYFFLYPTNLLLFLGFLMRIIASWMLWSNIRPTMYPKGLLKAYPILDFLFFLYNLILVPIGMISKPSWTKKQQSQKIPRKTGN
ncbi:MAG: glycosyltransferase [Bacteroidota bacterium]